jgi:hypothetical protein
MRKKVISFSVWGDNPDYLVGAKRNAELASEVYPDWETWFYVERGTNLHLESLATRVIYYDAEPGSDGMFQRFRPMEDSSVDVFVSRDCDSRLSDREYQAVQEWLGSDKQFHSMRDHAAHGIPVLGGMWGAKRFGLINLEFVFKKLCNYKNKNYFDDQRGLAFFYDMVPSLFLEHDDSLRFNGKPFPNHTPMIYGTFVGQRITFDDKEGRV